MTTQLGTRNICLKCSEEIIYNNVGVTTSIGSPLVMEWTTLDRLQDDICRAGGQHNPADTSAGGGDHMIARPAVMPTPDLSPTDEEEEKRVINPETTRRIEVIDMALSFGADPDTSMPLTDEKRRLLEAEKALLEGGATPEEATEATSLDEDVAAMLTNSFHTTTPEPEPAPVVHDEPLSTQEADMLEQFYTPQPATGEHVPTPVQNDTGALPPVTPEFQQAPATPPTPADNLMNPILQPTAPPEPSLGDTVKAAVSEALGALLNSGGGGSSSLDDLIAKLDPRDSESALKMFTWLWENHRFQVIGQLNGGGYMLHYAEPKGTTQAGYMPGGTKGGRMVDTALARAKDNPAAAKHGMCPQCMSAVKQNIETGSVTSDDEKNDPACPAGGNHAFAG